MGKDYLHFTTDDFIADEYFQRWVRFPDKETESFWRKWIMEHPEQRDDIMKASVFINHLNFEEQVQPDTEIEASLQRSLRMIHQKENSWKSKLKNKPAIKRFVWVGFFAVLIF